MWVITLIFSRFQQVRLRFRDWKSALGGARFAESVEHSYDLSPPMGRLAGVEPGQSHPGKVQGELKGGEDE